MTDVLDVTALREIAAQANWASQELFPRLEKVKGAQKRLEDRISEYNSGLQMFLETQLENTGRSWCGKCECIFPNSEIKLFYVEKFARTASIPRMGFYVGSVTQAIVRRCTNCAEANRASPDPFDCFLDAEKREDGYCVDGKLSPDVTLCNGLPDGVIKKLATEYDLPPKLELSAEIVTLQVARLAVPGELPLPNVPAV